MKFTKEQAVEKLNQELTNGGKKPLRMSARTLNEHAESLMTLVANEEMELDDFITKVKPMLENVNSNMEKDRSDFIKEYEKAHPAQQPTPTKPGAPPVDEEKTLLERMQEQLNELQEQNRLKAEKEAIEAKRAEIRKYLTDKNVTNAKWIDSVLSVATIGKDDDAQEKGKTFLELYNSSVSGSPVPPLPPAPGGGKPADDPFAAVRAIRKREEEGGQ